MVRLICRTKMWLYEWMNLFIYPLQVVWKGEVATPWGGSRIWWDSWLRHLAPHWIQTPPPRRCTLPHRAAGSNRQKSGSRLRVWADVVSGQRNSYRVRTLNRCATCHSLRVRNGNKSRGAPHSPRRHPSHFSQVLSGWSLYVLSASVWVLRALHSSHNPIN